MSKAVATYTFVAAQHGDLSFEPGDQILVLEKGSNGWWLGRTSDGREGIFPYNRVKLIEAAPSMPARQQVIYDRINLVSVVPDEPIPNSGQKFFVDVRLSNEKEISGAKSMKDFRILTAAFSSLKGTQVPLGKFDQLSQTMNEIPRWADDLELPEGFAQTKTRERADILGTFLKEMIGDPKFDYLLVYWIDPNANFSIGEGDKRKVQDCYRDGVADESKGFPTPNVTLVKALFPWNQQDQQEISFAKDEIMVKLGKGMYDGWWEGEKINGGRGVFPYNYVAEISPNDARDILNPVPMKKGQSNYNKKDKKSSMNLDDFTIQRQPKNKPQIEEKQANTFGQVNQAKEMFAQKGFNPAANPPGFNAPINNTPSFQPPINNSPPGMFNNTPLNSGQVNGMGLPPANTGFVPPNPMMAPLGLNEHKVEFAPATPSFRPPSKVPLKQARPRNKVSKYSLCCTEAFDELLQDGVTVEQDGKLAKFIGITDNPKRGDTVTLFYSGYIWEPQNQDLLEFAASDPLVSYSSEIIEPGPLVFTIGNEEAIDGIEETVSKMALGMSVRCTLTPDKAYKEVGFPPDIPGNAFLVYDLTLTDIKRGASGKPAQINNKGVLPSPVKSREVDPGFGQWMGGNSIRQIGNSQRNVVQSTQQLRTNLMGNQNAPKGLDSEHFKRKLTLQKVQDIVRKKNYAEYGINPAMIEEYLTEDEFSRAFNVDYSTWLLMPVHRRRDLKQRVQLF